MLRKAVIYIVLLLVFFTSSRSFFNQDFFYTHDFTHGARVVEMYKSLSDGHFPVRWTSDFGFGYGMPLFEFYAPLPYYVGALFLAVGFSLVWSVKLLFLIPSLVILVGGYKLGKSLFDRLGGLLLATTLTLVPYRAVNIFVRGAVSELWAMMTLPFILYGVISVVEDRKKGKIILLISLVILLLSHNLTTMMFLPLSVVFGAGYLFFMNRGSKDKKFFKNTIFSLMAIYFLSLGLTAFYWLPALLEKDLTKVSETVLNTYFNYQLHFVYLEQLFKLNWGYGGSSWGPSDGISFYLGSGQLFGLLVSLVFFIDQSIRFIKKKKMKTKDLEVVKSNIFIFLFSFTLFIFSLFMLSFKSQFVWQSLDFLKFVQFPWRWLLVASVFLSLLVGLVSKIKNTKLKYAFSSLVILITITTSWFIFKPEKLHNDVGEFYYSNENRIRNEMSGILPDYIPTNMQGVDIKPVAMVGNVLKCEVDDSCEFEFEKLVDNTQEKLIRVKLKEPTTIEFTTAYFPGWFIEVDGQKRESVLSEFGLNSVELDKGECLIGLKFGGSRVRKIADLTSLLSLVFLLSLYGWYYVVDSKNK